MKNNNYKGTSDRTLSDDEAKKSGSIKGEKRQEQGEARKQEEVNLKVIDGLVKIFKEESDRYQGKSYGWWTLRRRIVGGYRTYLLLTIILTIIVLIVSVWYFLYALGINAGIIDNTEIDWDDRINFLPVYFVLLFCSIFCSKAVFLL